MRNWGAQQQCARGPRQGLWGQDGARPRCRWVAAGLAGQHTDTPDRLEAAARPAGPGRAPKRRAQPHTRPHRCEGRRRALPRCRWAAAGPGRTTHRHPRPIGGRREACGAWPGFEPTRRAKLAARTASGRAGRAAAGDLSGQQITPQIRQELDTAQHRGAGPQARAPSATARTLRSTCVPFRSTRAAHRSRRSSRSPRLRQRAGPRR